MSTFPSPSTHRLPYCPDRERVHRLENSRIRSPTAGEGVVVGHDSSLADSAKKPADRAERLCHGAEAAERVRPDEHARLVDGKRRDVVVESALLAVLKELLLDVRNVERA